MINKTLKLFQIYNFISHVTRHNRPRTETVLYSGLKFQFEHVSREEKGAQILVGSKIRRKKK